MANAADSWFGFVPNYGANMTFCIFFALIAVYQCAMGIYKKNWWMCISWTICAGLECTAYIGRIILNGDVTLGSMWKMEISLSTFAPVFMAAALYYQLAVLVTIYGQHYSPVKPMTYNAIFMTCDVVALLIQSSGGGITANPDTKNLGEYITLAGIGFQIFTLFVFMVLAAWVWYRIRTDSPINYDVHYLENRERTLFKYWIPAVAVSLVFLFIRSIYRMVELSNGWGGPIIRNENYFLILDGLMIFLGMLVLSIIYPGVAYGNVDVPGLSEKRKRKNFDFELQSQDQKSDDIIIFN